VSLRLVVAPTDTPSDPTHAYSIGLIELYSHPELVIVGLPAEPALDFVAHAVSRVSRGRHFHDGERATDVFPGAAAILRRVGEQHLGEYLPEAVVRYGGTDFGALQIVYPDRAGLFPWDKGADLKLRLVQPVLEGKTRKCRWGSC
jgi:hypothetical protein